jgi:hypothetical protein
VKACKLLIFHSFSSFHCFSSFQGFCNFHALSSYQGVFQAPRTTETRSTLTNFTKQHENVVKLHENAAEQRQDVVEVTVPSWHISEDCPMPLQQRDSFAMTHERQYRLVNGQGEPHPVLDDLYESLDSAWNEATNWWSQEIGTSQGPMEIGVEVSTACGGWRTLRHPGR